MFEQPTLENILFYMLYAAVAGMSLIASIYLMFRRGNAFAPDITPPVSLRRWAAAFFAVIFLDHVWWFLFYIYCGNINSVYCWVVAVPDSMALLTTIAGTLFAMLQDQKRPVWPVVTGTIPYGLFLALHIVNPESHFFNLAIAYILLFYVLFSINMVFAVKQYGRWLRDNYADLEHKEIWMSQVLVILFLILVISDGLESSNMTIISYLLQITQIPFFGFMLWRIETLPQLESISDEQMCSSPAPETAHVIGMSLATEGTQEPDFPKQAQQTLTIPSNLIQQLLDEHCVATQLYLQHNLTLQQLAAAVGINRYYLSQFFSKHGKTYNAYINDLRINHFVCLYRETIAIQQPVIAQQLAYDSGYRSYSTFSLAFKQRMGVTVTVWMSEVAK